MDRNKNSAYKQTATAAETVQTFTAYFEYVSTQTGDTDGRHRRETQPQQQWRYTADAAGKEHLMTQQPQVRPTS